MDPTREAQVAEVWRDNRAHLVDLAFRMLGNIGDAEDMVQEAFTRLMRVDPSEIEEPRGWLTVVVSRLCLDKLRSAHSRREASAGNLIADAFGASAPGGTSQPDPADRITLDDNVRLALLVVLEQLTPAERAVFVLHDLFQFSFDVVGSIVGRSPAACRQLASRARRRVEASTEPARFDVDTTEHHEVAARFIAACAGGDIQALLEILDPEVVGDVDRGAGFPVVAPFVGSNKVSRNLLRLFGPSSEMTLVSQPVNGETGLLVFQHRDLVGVVVLTTTEVGIVHHIHAIVDPAKIAFVAAQMNSASGMTLGSQIAPGPPTAP